MHTRSARYGRLGRGQLVVVPPVLVPRQKHHCVALPSHGVSLVLGCNGHVWVHAPAPPAAGAGEDERMEEDTGEGVPADESAAQIAPVGPDLRLSICRIAGAVRALAVMMASITPTALTQVADAALAWGVPPRDMSGPAFIERLAQRHKEQLMDADE